MWRDYFLKETLFNNYRQKQNKIYLNFKYFTLKIISNLRKIKILNKLQNLFIQNLTRLNRNDLRKLINAK